MTQFYSRGAALAAFTALLTACGGGSGGSGSNNVTAADADVLITQSNANAIVREVNESTSFADGFIAGLTLAASATNAGSGGNDDVVIVVTPAAVQQCANPGGTVDVTVNEASRFADFEFTNCEDFNFEGAFFSGVNNGGLRITISSLVGEDDFVSVIDFRDYQNDDGGTSVVLDGRVTVDFLRTGFQVRTQLDTRDLTGSIDGDNFRLRDYRSIVIDTGPGVSQDARGGVSGSGFTGLAYLQTFEPLVTEGGRTLPTSGSYDIFGESGSRIRVQPQSDGTNVRIRLDLDDIDGFETSYLVTWTELLND